LTLLTVEKENKGKDKGWRIFIEKDNNVVQCREGNCTLAASTTCCGNWGMGSMGSQGVPCPKGREVKRTTSASAKRMTQDGGTPKGITPLRKRIIFKKYGKDPRAKGLGGLGAGEAACG